MYDSTGESYFLAIDDFDKARLSLQFGRAPRVNSRG